MVPGADRDPLVAQRFADLGRCVPVEDERAARWPCPGPCRSAGARAPAAGPGWRKPAARARIGGCSRFPRRSTYSSAASRPTASAMLPVPASNRIGGSWNSDRSSVTSAIMLPPGLPRRHRLEDGLLRVDDADAGGTVDLVPGEDEEVGIECLDVDVHVRDRLRTIDERAGSDPVRHGDHLGDRRDRPERIGDVGHRDELCAVAEEPLVLIEEQLAVIVHRDHLQHRSGPRRRAAARARCWRGVRGGR